ncbi:MAG: C-terminal processing peptidase-3 [Frankiales bacterium]|nr:C-terminal processing peptidase-3 [Frankiales bacterium]
MPVLTPSRRRTAALVAVVTGAYGVGLLGGTSTTPPQAPVPVAATTESPASRLTQSALTGQRPLDRSAVQALLDRMDDRWAAYLDPAEYARFEQDIDGHYTGVGVFVRRDPTGELSVASVQAHSPAAEAGLAVGDTIKAVDGQPVAALSVGAASAMLRGDAGTDVTVAVLHAGVAREVTMRRVVMADADVTLTNINDDVVKITVTSFTRGVGKEVRADVEAAHASGIVLDLRGNPGGLLHEAVEVASAFLDGGPVVTFVRTGEAPQQLDAVGTGNTTVPVVVLVDGGTASAAEVVAAALQDRGRAALIGSQTFGKGTVQQPLRLGDGAGVEFTVGTYLTPAGHSVDGAGLTPDIQVAVGASPTVAVARAVAVLSGLMADAQTAGRG